MYPSGHARNTTCNLEDILLAKFAMLGEIAMDNPSVVIDRCSSIASLDCDGHAIHLGYRTRRPACVQRLERHV